MLTICEWELALAAYAYEVRDRPTMTDNSYDRLAASIAKVGSELPGFSDMTGQWVHGMDMDLLSILLDYAWSLNSTCDDLHMPFIRASLDKHNVPYCCCLKGFNCWDDVNI